MKKSMLREIHAIQQMSVGELREKWRELYDGEESRSRNRSYLVKRLCWRVQEIEFGGLSDRAKARIEELAPDGFVRARTPSQAVPAPSARNVASIRDARRPTPGTVLTRQWHDQEIRVLVLDDGFEWDGRRYQSLSEVARAITGQRWSGPLFFGLRKRKRS